MGIGTTPLGPTTPAGFAVAPELADPPTDYPTESRFIDPISKDWVPDTGNSYEWQRMPTTRQRVFLALTTVKGSNAALFGFGFDLPRKMDSAFDRRVTTAVQSALYQLLQVERRITLDSVSVERTAQRAVITVSYTDLETGEEDTVIL